MRDKTLCNPPPPRVAKLRHNTAKHRLFRSIGGRTLVTIAFGTAMSIGGATQALQDVHFLLQRDLHGIGKLRDHGEHAKVAAKLNDGFAANSIFNVSRVIPEAAVEPRITLFDSEWLPTAPDVPQVHRDVYREEMSRINDAIGRDFFANAVPFGGIIHDKAEKYDVDPALVAAVMETESDFQDRALSPVGARGLMQIMPNTGRWLGARNLYDPEQNVDAGVRYLKYLQERFDGNLKKTLAAYNAGEGNVERYGGIPPFNETRSYVKNVLNRYRKRKRQFEQYGARRQPPPSSEGVAGLR